MAEMNLNANLVLKTNQAVRSLKQFNDMLLKVQKTATDLAKKTSGIKVPSAAGGAGIKSAAGGIGGAGLAAGGAAISGLGAASTAAAGGLTVVNSALVTIAGSLSLLTRALAQVAASFSTTTSTTKAWEDVLRRLPKVVKENAEANAKWSATLLQVDRAERQVTDSTRKSVPVFQSAARSFLKFLGPLVGAAGVSSIVRTGAEFESLRATLTSVLPKANETAGAFALIKDIASKLPTTVQETTDAFIRMQALGITPTRERMIAFGNVAAAMGKSVLQFTEAVADASVGEFERLKEFGIKASTQGDKVTFRFKGNSKEIGNNATEIVNFLQQIGETDFSTAASNQMNTLTGKTSNLKDAMANLKDTIAQGGLNDTVKSLVVFLKDVVDAINDNYDIVQRFGISIVDVFGKLLIFFAHMGRSMGVVFGTAFDNVFVLAQNTAIKVKNAWNDALRGIASFLGIEGEVADANEATIAYGRYASAAKELNDERAAALEQHAAIIAAMKEDTYVTKDATKAADDYNEVLKQRALEEANEQRRQADKAAAQAKTNKMLEEAKKIYEDTRTPAENLATQIDHLNVLLEAGAFGDINTDEGFEKAFDTYSRAIFKAQDEFDELTKEAEKTSTAINEFFAEGARGIQQSFDTFFFDVMQGRLTDLVGSIKTAIDRAVSNFLASQLATFLFGSAFQSGTIGGVVGSVFGGARAMGGPVEAGKLYQVNERRGGPEFFQPDVSGKIIPLGEGGGGTRVTNISIHANDAKSFMDMIESNDRGILDVMKNATTAY